MWHSSSMHPASLNLYIFLGFIFPRFHIPPWGWNFHISVYIKQSSVIYFQSDQGDLLRTQFFFLVLYSTKCWEKTGQVLTPTVVEVEKIHTIYLYKEYVPAIFYKYEEYVPAIFYKGCTAKSLLIAYKLNFSFCF